jgi:hypothetical protein
MTEDSKDLVCCINQSVEIIIGYTQLRVYCMIRLNLPADAYQRRHIHTDEQTATPLGSTSVHRLSAIFSLPIPPGCPRYYFFIACLDTFICYE